jgi:hypothetical protein
VAASAAAAEAAMGRRHSTPPAGRCHLFFQGPFKCISLAAADAASAVTARLRETNEPPSALPASSSASPPRLSSTQCSVVVSPGRQALAALLRLPRFALKRHRAPFFPPTSLYPDRVAGVCLPPRLRLRLLLSQWKEGAFFPSSFPTIEMKVFSLRASNELSLAASSGRQLAGRKRQRVKQ